MSAVITDIRRPHRRTGTAYTVTLLLPDGSLRDYPLTAANLGDLARTIQAVIHGATLKQTTVTLDRGGRVFTRYDNGRAEHTGTWAAADVIR